VAQATDSLGVWTFGWDALVALFTLLLASATVWLAYTTRRLTAATTNDVEAQWRPVLIPGAYVHLDPKLNPEAQRNVLILELHNAGRGPALYVRIHLDPGGASPEDWSLGAIPPDGRQELKFTGVSGIIDGHMQLLIDYRDLAERTYSSTIVIAPRGAEFVFYDVHHYRDHTVTSLGDAVQQADLTDVRPQPTATLRQRVGRKFR
jgi:hypothetical protein